MNRSCYTNQSLQVVLSPIIYSNIGLTPQNHPNPNQMQPKTKQIKLRVIKSYFDLTLCELEDICICPSMFFVCGKRLKRAGNGMSFDASSFNLFGLNNYSRSKSQI